LRGRDLKIEASHSYPTLQGKYEASHLKQSTPRTSISLKQTLESKSEANKSGLEMQLEGEQSTFSNKSVHTTLS
jgi:hypothetical protein